MTIPHIIFTDTGIHFRYSKGYYQYLINQAIKDQDYETAAELRNEAKKRGVKL